MGLSSQEELLASDTILHAQMHITNLPGTVYVIYQLQATQVVINTVAISVSSQILWLPFARKHGGFKDSDARAITQSVKSSKKLHIIGFLRARLSGVIGA